MEAKKLIKILIREYINRILTEEVDTIDDWYSLENELTRDIFYMIKNHEKITFELMPKTQYLNALKEFMKYGSFMRFPERVIFGWKQLLLENIAKLEILTSIAGHTAHFPYDDFYDTFDSEKEIETNQYDLFTGGIENKTIDGEFTKWAKEKYEETGDKKYIKKYQFNPIYEFLDEVYKMDEVLPLFSNGQWVLSDYGLKPLFELGEEIIKQKDPDEIIVTINRILDVAHQRSDIAELFIEGGSKSLTAITNDPNLV